MNDNQAIKASDDVLSRVIDGDAVLLDLASGTYFGLNEVGSRVWELISAGSTVGDVRTTIHSEFEVDQATLDADLEELFTSLTAKGLIEIA
ncbi:PqqD family protein [Endomicrobium sp. AH-315-J14]|nr:PqqD family protein [Endomicrobium sp. AH-315-J14]